MIKIDLSALIARQVASSSRAAAESTLSTA